jgi:hypothetical protein
MPRRARFDFDAALNDAESRSASIGRKNTELAHPLIHEWIRRAHARQQTGRLVWSRARDVIALACEAHGLPPLRSSAAVIADYARRKFGSG